jgi:ribonuclease HII
MLKKQFQKNLIEAGCDEVGRGCIAGPVVAAAVILPTKYFNNSIIDSKKLSPNKREEVGKEIIGNAIAWSVSEVSNNTIDKINILNASILAMHRALDKLKVRPEFIIVDGNKFKPYKNVKHECIIKGDNKFQNIAAASILAKNYRDDLMKNLSQKFDKYSWESNFGYPTKKHRDSIIKHGATEYHRKSFKLL